jgi:large subunit ribosomal protein L15
VYRQGGNLPFYRRLPFMRGEGFTPPNRVEFNEVNLDQLAAAFKAEAEVNPETLAGAHLLREASHPVKVLGRGDIKIALKVRVHRVSASARAKIEAAGGSVENITK